MATGRASAWLGVGLLLAALAGRGGGTLSLVGFNVQVCKRSTSIASSPSPPSLYKMATGEATGHPSPPSTFASRWMDTRATTTTSRDLELRAASVHVSAGLLTSQHTHNQLLTVV